MKIIIDDKIPYIQEAIKKIAEEVVYISGKDFTPELIQDAVRQYSVSMWSNPMVAVAMNLTWLPSSSSRLQ